MGPAAVAEQPGAIAGKVGISMLKYVLKRLVYMVFVFLVVTLLMYSLYNLIPSDPARAQVEPMRSTLKPDQYEAMYRQIRLEMGLDDPLIVRYARWMGLAPNHLGNYSGLLQGNFGYSNFFKKPVIEVIPEPMKYTIFINIFVTIFSLGITIPLGIKTAVKKDSRLDAACGGQRHRLFHTDTYHCLGLYLPVRCGAAPFPVMGMKTPGNYRYAAFGICSTMSLCPCWCTFGSLGSMTRYVRAAMIDALSMDYVRTARAGCAEKVVIYSHAWRNALLPVITIIIGWFLGILAVPPSRKPHFPSMAWGG